MSSTDDKGAGAALISGTASGCQVVAVGKRRDGGTRFWCLRHKADATAKYGKRAKVCRASHIPPIRSADILKLNIDKYKGGVAMWGAVPAVYDTTRLPMDRGIHVHARAAADAKKELDRTFRAVLISSRRLPGKGILVSERDAIYYMVSSVFGFRMKYITCSYCGFPHLDQDWFSVHPHRRHLCAGCGRHFGDTETSIGNPICGIRSACGIKIRKPRLSRKTLNFRQADFPGGIQIWGTNPAFIWTNNRQEEAGIHVHAFLKSGDEPELDDTYGTVLIDGVRLDPLMVRVMMAQSVLPSLKNRTMPLICPSCRAPQFSVGNQAFIPTATHRCKACGHEFATPGRLRKAVANPLPGLLMRLAEKAPRRPQHHDLDLLPETL